MSACIKCGGTDDLKDRGMAPGMTYCAPCRRAMSEGTGPRDREEIIAAAKIEHDRVCSCDPRYLMSCGRMAEAILAQGAVKPDAK